MIPCDDLFILGFHILEAPETKVLKRRARFQGFGALVLAACLFHARDF